MRKFFKVFIITNLIMIILFALAAILIHIKTRPNEIDLQQIYFLKLSDNTKTADIIINDKWEMWAKRNKDKQKEIPINDLKSCLEFAKIKNKTIKKGDTVQVFIKIDNKKAKELGYIFKNNKIYLYVDKEIQ